MAELKAYRKKYLNKLVTPNREEYVLTLKNIGTVSADDIIEEAADHCRLQKGDIRTAFDAITQAMVLFLKIGHGVQVPNIGSLQPSIRAKAVLTAEACTQETLKGTGGVSINMQPIGDFKKAVEGFKIRIVKSASDDTAVEDGDNENDGSNPPSGGGNSNNNAGNQQGGVTPSDVTYTFKYHDNTEDSRTGLPGAAVDAPEPDSGYRWNEVVPSVFGSVNKTFTEVAVAQAGGTTGNETYTATFHIGNMYVTRTGAAGSVLDLPELESGYVWPSNMPTVMPAMDFVAYAIEGEQDLSTTYTLTVQHNSETLRTEQLHADDIVFLGTAPDGYKWKNLPRSSKMPARNWTVSTEAV